MSWKNILVLALVLGMVSISAKCCPLEKYVSPPAVG